MPRARVPSHLKKLRGTFVPTQDPGEAPDALGTLTVEPRHLTISQRVVWRYALKSAPEGVLKRIDRDLLVSWCILVDRQRRANRELVEATDPDEIQKYLRIVSETTRIMVTLAGALGFSPAGRHRLAVDAAKVQKEASPWGGLRAVS